MIFEKDIRSLIDRDIKDKLKIELERALNKTARDISTTNRFQNKIEVKEENNNIKIKIDDPVAVYLEEGVKPHIIKPKYKKALKFKKLGKIIFAKKVNHPGYKPRRYFSKTIEKVLKYVRFIKRS